LEIFLRYLSWWALVLFLSLLLALKLISGFNNQEEIPMVADPQAANLFTVLACFLSSR